VAVLKATTKSRQARNIAFACLEYVDILATEHPLYGAVPVRHMTGDQLHIQSADRVTENFVKFS
jgi:hypothetical protein